MLSYNLRSTARKLSVSSGPGSMSRKSSKVIDGQDEKYKLKAQLQLRRLTVTPRDRTDERVFFDESSPSPLIPTEEANADSTIAYTLDKKPFLDVNDQSEFEDFIRKKTSATSTAVDGLPSLTEGKETSPGVGANELQTDLNTSMQDLSGGKDEESSTDSEELTGWKKFATTVLPHVGLILLTCTYTLIGASIFYSIEQPNEKQTKEKRLTIIHHAKNDFLTELWKRARRSDATEDEFATFFSDNLDNLTDLMYRSFEEFHMTSMEMRDNRTHQIWTFPAAIFFAVTVVTTVGYGNPVPLTFLGRMACIFFALIGVPLTLLTIADVGKFFSEHLIWLYGCYLELKLKLQSKVRSLRKTSSFQKLCDKCRDKHIGEENLDRHTPAKSLQLQHVMNDLENYDLQEKTVPASLLLFILICYTALGGLLLCNVEAWTFFESFYFSFITMTTIGFGDLVPTKNGHIFLILLYIILGLIITTMCIDLVGVHYVKKIHYFGRKIRDARSALAIVGGKVVYISDLYAQFLSKRYGIPKDQIALMSDAFIIENLYSTKHLIPFIPRDIKRIRYIDEGSESFTTSSGSCDDFSCKYCHSRMTVSASHYSNSPNPHQRLV